MEDIEEQDKKRATASNTLVERGFQTASFIIPFCAVTLFSLSKSDAACLAHGAYACQLSAIIIGTLAGFTSMILMKVIKQKAKTFDK